MKKILIFMMILSLLTLCACRNSAIDDLPDGVNDPSESDSGSTESSDENTIDWETPIDIDDAFQQETEDEEQTDTTEPEGEIDTTDDETTAPENKPTQPNATEPTATEPDPTEAVTNPKPSKPGSSGPIELPMIPG